MSNWGPVIEGVRVLRPDEVVDAQRQARERFSELATARGRDMADPRSQALLDQWYPATAPA